MPCYESFTMTVAGVHGPLHGSLVPKKNREELRKKNDKPQIYILCMCI